VVMRKLLFVFIIFLLFFDFSYGKPYEKPKVVGTIYPLYLIARDIGGDKVEVSYLKSLAVSPHFYEVSYSDTEAIDRASVIFAVGCGIENNMKGILRKKKVVYLCEKGLRDRRDPHLWLSPTYVKQRVFNFADALSQIDPTHSEYYRKRAWDLSMKLEKLIGIYRKRFTGKGISVIDRHGAWRYMASEVDWNYIGAIESVPHKEPTMKDMERIISRARGIKRVIVINDAGHDDSIVDRIVKKLGACKVTLYPLGKGVESSFIDLIKENLDEFEKCVTIR